MGIFFIFNYHLKPEKKRHLEIIMLGHILPRILSNKGVSSPLIPTRELSKALGCRTSSQAPQALFSPLRFYSPQLPSGMGGTAAGGVVFKIFGYNTHLIITIAITIDNTFNKNTISE